MEQQQQQQQQPTAQPKRKADETFTVQTKHKWLRATIALSELIMQGRKDEAEHAAYLFYRGRPEKLDNLAQ